MRLESADRLVRSLYVEFAAEDDEPPSVSVEHESTWSLGAYGGGLLVWETVDLCT